MSINIILSKIKKAARENRLLSTTVWHLTPGIIKARLYKLSIIVPVYNVEEYLAECLNSILRQTYRWLEVVVIVDGATDGSLQIAELYSIKDKRVKVFYQKNQGLSAARNKGVEKSTGKFIWFIDSDDTIPKNAAKKLVRSLQINKADFAVGKYRRFNSRGPKRAAYWIQLAHKRTIPNVKIEDFPKILVNAMACSKVFRRSFWEKENISFPEGMIYEDQPISALAYCKANSFNIIKDNIYNWRIREDRSSITQQTKEISNVRVRMEVMLDALKILERRGKSLAVERAIQYLSNDMGDYLPHIQDADIEFLNSLASGIRRIIERVPTERLAEIPAERAALEWLLLNRKFEEASTYIQEGGLDLTALVGTVFKHKFLLKVPFWDNKAIAYPIPILEMSPRQILPTTAIRKAYWKDKDNLYVEGWAYMALIDPAVVTSVSLELVCVKGRRHRVNVPLARMKNADVDRVSKHQVNDYSTFGFSCLLYVDGLGLEPNMAYELEFSFLVGGDIITTSKVDFLKWGSAANIRPTITSRNLKATFSPNSGGFYLSLRKPGWKSKTTRSLGDSDRLTLRLVKEVSSGVEISGRLEEMAEPISVYIRDHRYNIVCDVAVDSTNNEFQIVIPWKFEAWGKTKYLPSGNYQLTLEVGRKFIKPQLSDSFVREIPFWVSSDAPIVARLEIHPKTKNLSLTVEPTVDKSEWGARHRRQFIEQHRHSSVLLDSGAVLFRTYYGETATDSARAVHRELRRRKLDLKLYWAVKDSSVHVPEGGIPVVINSRQWYELYSSSKYIFDNTHEPEFFYKRPGQVIVATFHGYPFKLAGMPFWRKQGISEKRISSYLRRQQQWDYLLSPAPYATPILQSVFPTPAKILETGYPRNDIFFSDDIDDIRKKTRTLLGITDKDIVILYAPTFRDSLSRDDFSARMMPLLNMEHLVESLGERYIVLLRGHAFNARTAQRMDNSSSRIIDVTDYPEIADLCIASDMAVLDYSSLRFDYALTGKPIIFFVPDLESYCKSRGGTLVPFEYTAPGPWVTNTDDVIYWVKTILVNERSYKESRREFVRNYMPLEDGRASSRLVDQVFGEH